MIQVHRISKKYQETQVIDEVSLEIPQGGLTAIIGPNGAGKSTLLSMISRLIPMDSGKVEVDGLDVTRTPGAQLAKRLAILRQHNESTLRLTVRELVAFGRFPHSGGRLTVEDQQHINEAIHYLELGDYEHRYLDELSGGQRQRAYIAMILCQDTDYVLLDEPLNNIDIHYAVSMMKLLRHAVDEKGKTIVVVLHDINFASCYADHIIAMRKGQLAYEGTPTEVISNEVLSDLYNLPMQVHELNGQRICTYY